MPAWRLPTAHFSITQGVSLQQETMKQQAWRETNEQHWRMVPLSLITQFGHLDLTMLLVHLTYLELPSHMSQYIIFQLKWIEDRLFIFSTDRLLMQILKSLFHRNICKYLNPTLNYKCLNVETVNFTLERHQRQVEVVVREV